MRIACWVPKATNTQSEYVIPTAFPLQQWLHERASMLSSTFICLSDLRSCLQLCVLLNWRQALPFFLPRYSFFFFYLPFPSFSVLNLTKQTCLPCSRFCSFCNCPAVCVITISDLTVVVVHLFRSPKCAALDFVYIAFYTLSTAQSFLRSRPVLSQSSNYPHFMEPESSLPHSEVPATCPYPKPAPIQFIPPTHHIF